MDYLNTIEKIKKKLSESNCTELSSRILELQLSGGTGGEVLISVCSELLKIKNNNRQVFDLIKKESYDLIAYARSIGLYPS